MKKKVLKSALVLLLVGFLVPAVGGAFSRDSVSSNVRAMAGSQQADQVRQQMRKRNRTHQSSDQVRQQMRKRNRDQAGMSDNGGGVE